MKLTYAMLDQIGYIAIFIVLAVVVGFGARIWLKPSASDQIYVKFGCIDKNDIDKRLRHASFLGLEQCSFLD